MTAAIKLSENAPLRAANPRTIVSRPSVGAAGRIIQNAQLTSHRVAVDQATLIFVQHGRKRISWSIGDCVARAGEAIAIEAGQVVDISNMPDSDGAYNARWISWNDDALSAFYAAASSIAPFSIATLLPRLSSEFSEAYDAAFESISNIDGVPASVANHRVQELLLWLNERGIAFHSPAAILLVGGFAGSFSAIRLSRGRLTRSRSERDSVRRRCDGASQRRT